MKRPYSPDDDRDRESVMKTGADLDIDRAWHNGGVSPILHTSRSCLEASKAKRIRAVDPSNYEHNAVCLKCDEDYEIDHGKPGKQRTCRECAGLLNADGECEWCANFEAVLGRAD